MSFTVAGLFSGCGMLEYAAHQLGGESVLMCENAEFPQRILRRRFPDVPLVGDVREVDGSGLAADVLVFGFPCQDISSAGRGAGIEGERSSLWKEGFRVLSEMRPEIALIENVAMLRNRGLDVVLADLKSIGYHAEWDVIPAAAVGAPHLRERIFIVARPAELAQQPVYGEVAQDRHGNAKTFTLDGKLPRAGRMAEQNYELVPIAPRKTKRHDSWSYWTGVSLLGFDADGHLWPTIHGVGRDEYLRQQGPSGNELGRAVNQARRLWPTSAARDWKDVGDLNCVPEKGLLRRRVFHVEQGSIPLLPSPVARDDGKSPEARDDGKSPEAHMAMKGRLPGGPRQTITSLAVLARNGFEQPNGKLYPTPVRTDAANAGNRPPSAHACHSLSDVIVRNLRDPSRIERTSLESADSGDEVVAAVAPAGASALLSADTSRRRPEKLWRTPAASDGSGGGMDPEARLAQGHTLNLQEQVFGEGSRGSLNPTWVEHMMSIPMFWTDPDCHNAFILQLPWWEEPERVPRTKTKVRHRANRLRAIGNAVCWPCAYVALERALLATPSVEVSFPSWGSDLGSSRSQLLASSSS